jgi:lactate dehydrogenase-like 2-hydroxyacid dehydrogenase
MRAPPALPAIALIRAYASFLPACSTGAGDEATQTTFASYTVVPTTTTLGDGDGDPETSGLIGAAQLAALKPGAILIQASRGGIVDETALAGALESGHLGGAAVDVYSSEPPSLDNPLLKLSGEAAQRLLLTPHIAGVTRQASAFLFRTAWENVERVLLRGEAPLNRVY